MGALQSICFLGGRFWVRFLALAEGSRQAKSIEVRHALDVKPQPCFVSFAPWAPSPAELLPLVNAVRLSWR